MKKLKTVFVLGVLGSFLYFPLLASASPTTTPAKPQSPAKATIVHVPKKDVSPKIVAAPAAEISSISVGVGQIGVIEFSGIKPLSYTLGNDGWIAKIPGGTDGEYLEVSPKGMTNANLIVFFKKNGQDRLYNINLQAEPDSVKNPIFIIK